MAHPLKRSTPESCAERADIHPKTQLGLGGIATTTSSNLEMPRGLAQPGIMNVMVSPENAVGLDSIPVLWDLQNASSLSRT